MKIPSIKKEYFSAFSDTILIMVLTILPTFLSLFAFIFNSDGRTLYSMYKSGEFLLYSVSFLGSAFMVFNQYNLGYKNFNNYSKLTITFTIIISLAYASLSSVTPNPNPIRIASILSFLISLIIFYYSQVINNRHSPDIGKQRREEQEAIENALN